MKNSILILLVLMVMIPCSLSAAITSYDQLIARETEAYTLKNIELVSFDGNIWARQNGMKEYYLTPSVKEIKPYIIDMKDDRGSTGGYRFVRAELNQNTVKLLKEYLIEIPKEYPKNHINLSMPSIHVEELISQGADISIIEMEYSTESTGSNRENRQLIYEELFEEPLGNEYDFATYIDNPNILYRNLQWGLVSCEAYEGEQSIWCVAELSGTGWYDDPPEPCSHYENWTWNAFQRVETIDVTVAEELVFEYYTRYNLDPSDFGDWMRVWVIDYPTTDWQMIGEYNGYTEWTDMQYELEGMSNFAYYFELESDMQEYAFGIYVDNVSIYNMVPNLTWGENSSAEYPYDYSVEEPHNLYVGYEIVNDSNADVDDAFTTEIVLSVDDDYTTAADNYPLEEINVPGGLDSGDIIAGEIIVNLDDLQIPGGGDLPPGSYYLMYMVDNGEDVEEYDEEDNLCAFTGQLVFGSVNLTPGAGSSYTYPATPGTSQLQVVAEVVNSGTEPCNTQFTNAFFLSADNDIATTNDNYSLGNVNYPDPIPAGGSSTQTLTADISLIPTLPAGDYWVFFTIDSNAAVGETDENDNVWMSGGQLTYAGLPYLTVTPQVLNFTADAGSQDLAVSSNTNWAAVENADWITLSITSGNGDATVTVIVNENTATDPRSDTITFTGAGETIIVNVNQEENTSVLYGDVDGSLVIDAYDASLVLQYVVGIPTGIDPFPEVNANVDGEGDVSAYDAGLILQYIVGIIDQFPVEARSRK